MKGYRLNLYRIPIAILFLALILDSKTVILGASDAVDLCLRTVVPSLFPFIFFSGLLRTVWGNAAFTFLRPLGKFCKLPSGSEKILFLGLIGGYPVGAKCVYDSYRDGTIDYNHASRLLGFCNNAGPSFIIGIVGFLFDQIYIGWIILVIQIASALITGWLVPANSPICISNSSHSKMKITLILKQAIMAIATVCGWVIIFRVILQVLSKWLLWLLPEFLQVAIAGTLEMTNGVILLSKLSSPYTRFIFANLFLSLGGICILLQTVSVAPGLNYRIYLLEKTLQTSVCLLLSISVGYILFPGNSMVYVFIGTAIAITAGIPALHYIKRTRKTQADAV